MHDTEHIIRTIGLFLSHLPLIMIAAATAGFGLSMPGGRGKVWLAIWASCTIVSMLWWGSINALSSANVISWEMYEKLQIATPMIGLFQAVGWACMLLYVVSQRRDARSDFGRILFSFEGRISRQSYWISAIALTAGTWACVAFYLMFTADSIEKTSRSLSIGNTKMIVAGVVMWLWTLASIWPSLAIQVKRWHDRGKSGWMVLINFIPLAGPVWSLIELGFLPGTPAANAYGDDPLKPAATAKPELSGLLIVRNERTHGLAAM